MQMFWSIHVKNVTKDSLDFMNWHHMRNNMKQPAIHVMTVTKFSALQETCLSIRKPMNCLQLLLVKYVPMYCHTLVIWRNTWKMFMVTLSTLMETMSFIWLITYQIVQLPKLKHTASFVRNFLANQQTWRSICRLSMKLQMIEFTSMRTTLYLINQLKNHVLFLHQLK